MTKQWIADNAQDLDVREKNHTVYLTINEAIFLETKQRDCALSVIPR